MEQKKCGKNSKGEDIILITLQNRNGMKAEVTNLGACLVNLIVPDKDGKFRDVVAAYQNLETYEENPCFFGATIGRSGNRIGNACFTINGKEYKLEANNHVSNLHSGPDGFQLRMWNFETEKGDDAECCTFFINSPDMDQGYPGNMDVEVTYTLTDDNELMINYYGLSDQDTIMNMTNHSYFNLNGHDDGSILGHKLTVFSDAITATDDYLIPNGQLRPVEGTPFDFRNEKEIGLDIKADDRDLKNGGGYDHNFVVNDGKVQEDAELVARVKGEKSGIVMEVYTDLPGMQFYTACTTNYENGKEGASYKQYSLCCFETQFAPNAINLPEYFASPILKANQEKNSLTVYRFTTEA